MNVIVASANDSGAEIKPELLRNGDATVDIVAKL